MNFKGYFLLAVATVLVVFAQQTDADFIDKVGAFFENGLEAIKNEFSSSKRLERETIRIIQESCKQNIDSMVYVNATNVLEEGYIKGVKAFSQSIDIIKNGLKAAYKIVLDNPESAKKTLQQAFADAKVILFQSGIPVLEAIGKSLGLSNDGAEQKCRDASELIQRAGFKALNPMNAAANSIEEGLDAAGKAGKELLKAATFAVKSGYAGALNNIQESIKLSTQALKDAQNSPMQEKVETCDTSSAAEGSDATSEINDAANDALKRGANAVQVEKLRGISICSVAKVVNITADAKQTIENNKKIAGIEPFSAKIVYLKQADSVKNAIHKVAAAIYVILGNVYVRSGNQSDSILEGALGILEEAKAELFMAIDTAGVVLDIGQNYGGDAPTYAVKAASKYVDYAELAFLQGIVEGVKPLFSVL